MKNHEKPLKSDLPGYCMPQDPMGGFGFLMGAHGSPWVPMGTHGFSMDRFSMNYRGGRRPTKNVGGCGGGAGAPPTKKRYTFKMVSDFFKMVPGIPLRSRFPKTKPSMAQQTTQTNNFEEWGMGKGKGCHV